MTIIGISGIYDLGDQATLTGRFYSDAALTVPASPTTVVLSLRSPSGVVTTPAPTPAGTGVYTYAWTPTEYGLWEANWTGTGAIVAAEQEAVYVRAGITTPGELCTVADVKLAASLPDERDAIIQECITQASAAIQKRYGREFAPAPGTPTRRIRTTGPLLSLEPYDLREATTVVLDPAGTPITLAATDWRYGPLGVGGTYLDLALRRTLSTASTSRTEYGFVELDITGTWGFAEIPPDVRRAAVVTVASWTDRAAAQYALELDGDPMAASAFPAQTWAIPNAAHRLLQPYQRIVF